MIKFVSLERGAYRVVALAYSRSPSLASNVNDNFSQSFSGAVKHAVNEPREVQFSSGV